MDLHSYVLTLHLNSISNHLTLKLHLKSPSTDSTIETNFLSLQSLSLNELCLLHKSAFINAHQIYMHITYLQSIHRTEYKLCAMCDKFCCPIGRLEREQYKISHVCTNGHNDDVILHINQFFKG